MTAAGFCPRCGHPRTEGLSFCGKCGADFGAPLPTNPRSDRQQLARGAMTVQTVQLVGYAGGILGFVAGVLVPGLPIIGMEEPGLLLLVPFTIGPLIGTILGARIALALLAR